MKKNLIFGKVIFIFRFNVTFLILKTILYFQFYRVCNKIKKYL